MTNPDCPPVLGANLCFGLTPWDSAACGFPVGQITSILIDPPPATAPWQTWDDYEAWRDREGVRMVSCRLESNRLREGMFLESRGFNFIEIVLRLELDIAPVRGELDQRLLISRARPEDIPAIGRIAETAFATDRFSVDPRLPKGASGIRYRRWVENTPQHPTQELFKIETEGVVAAFFITELQPDGTCHWQLTAVAPGLHGRGLGKRIWRNMMVHARSAGARRITTVISALNTTVVNLYAGLGFRFHSPATTYHWIRD